MPSINTLGVDDESYIWLPCTREEVKPDFAVVHHAFYVLVDGAGDLCGSLFVD